MSKFITGAKFCKISKLIEKSWYTEAPLRLLQPLSYAYALAAKIRPLLYSTILKQSQAKIPVVSIGNLSVGGAGKTPMSLALAKLALGKGLQPAVLSRGYGRDKSLAAPPVKVSLGEGPIVTPAQSGDEPWLMAESLKGLMVLVDADRVRGAKAAADEMNAGLIILDDGFQQLALKADCRILLIPFQNPFGNGCLLPAGPLREAVSGHKRANILVCTGSDTPSELVLRLAQGRPVFTAGYHALHWRDHQSGHCDSLSSLAGKKAFVFCGLARPQNFYSSIEKLNIKIISFQALADHQKYDSEILNELGLKFLASKADFMLTSAKDAVKIPNSFSLPLKILDVEMNIDKADDFINTILNMTTRQTEL